MIDTRFGETIIEGAKVIIQADISCISKALAKYGVMTKEEAIEAVKIGYDSYEREQMKNEGSESESSTKEEKTDFTEEHISLMGLLFTEILMERDRWQK